MGVMVSRSPREEQENTKENMGGGTKEKLEIYTALKRD